MKEYGIESGTALAEEPITAQSPGADQFAHLPLSALVSSLTNPRKNFDGAKLRELADSIRAGGVHQPILVRPLPGSRVEETYERHCTAGLHATLPTHEIVSGERRFRASTIAGAATIPALIRPLSDDQVLEIQIVENLQRDDLTELEEAEGYEQLMAHNHVSAEDVGGKIGKSCSYVYARLKLLELCPEGQQLMRDGLIDASRALLIARIPDGKLQFKALEFATHLDDYDKTPPSVRELQTWLQGHVMLRLDRAPFNITDARLLAGVGSCKDCPKRTGANPDLFADVVGADICTDPPCYTRKADAHHDRLVAQAKAKGMRVIDGKEAKEIIAHQYTNQLSGYTRLATRRKDVDPDGPTLAKLLGKDAPGAVLIEHPWTKELIEAVPTEEAEAVLLAKGLIKIASTQGKGRSLDQEIKRLQEDAARDIDRAARKLSYDALVAAVRNTPNSAAPGLVSNVLRAWLIRQIDEWDADNMALWFDIELPEADTLSQQETFLRLHIQACDSGTLWRALTIYMITDDGSGYYANSERAEPTLFAALAPSVSVDLAALKAQASATVRAETAAKIKKLKAELKPQKPPAATTPLAPAGALPAARYARKPKLSAQEAQAGIAAALQKLEAEPGGSEAAPPDQAVPVLKAGRQGKPKSQVIGA